METRICCKCQLSKPLNLFYKRGKSGFISYCKPCVSERQKQRFFNRRCKMLELMGGCCARCGYDKYHGALELHHIDSENKEYDWRKLRQISWKKVIEELKKCILLCSNCHREIHDEQRNKTRIETNSGNPALDKKIIPTGKCPICESDTYGTTYCSRLCSSVNQRKINRPSRAELENLIKTESFVSIGKKYQVSDNAIRKWARIYGLL